MKKYLYTFLGTILVFYTLFFTTQAHAVSWGYSRSITVTSTASIASGTLTNFPMLVSSTYPDWASSGHGGVVQNLVTAPSGGQEAADLVFATSTANCTAGGYLNFETESYSSTTGALVDWVNVPTVQAGTVIYACYDSASVTTNQSHPSSTWNSGYVGVWHLADPTSTLTTFDSTANAFNATAISVTASSTGQIDGAMQNAAAGTARVTDTGIPILEATSTLTVSAWAYAYTKPGSLAIVSKGENPNANNAADAYDLEMADGSNFRFRYWNASDNLAGSAVDSLTFATGTWYYVVGVISVPSGTINLYRNGVLQDSEVITDNIATGTAPFQIGEYSRFGNGQWNGVIDETRISNTVLPPQQILTEYNNQNSPDAAQSSTGFYAVGAQTSFGGGVLTTGVQQLFLDGKFILKGVLKIL